MMEKAVGKQMGYQVAFISLGCAKNQVNTEQMMGLVQAAGHGLLANPEGADVVVVNTCGFIESAKEEAIDHILQMAELKANGGVKKILVTGCMAQRYQQQILAELPEVDGVLGTGSYSDIVRAIEEVMAQGKPCYFGNIHETEDEGARVLSTPSYYAYLRIAEGCDNHCAYCIIPSLRGKYRSRPIEKVLAEAQKLADGGVKELLVIAQDITRYGIDLYGERSLARLLRELCKMNFHWIRLHYLYPDEITEELIETIAQEPKILKYLDLPIQHCNDQVLVAMNRRGNKEYVRKLFETLRKRIPGLVLRTSLITGLPFEDEAAFEELCDFLRDVRIERAGVFPYSPEEGTAAALMENRVSTDEANRRAELLVDVQSEVIDQYNDSLQGTLVELLCEGFSVQDQAFVGRSYAESPDIDGSIYFSSEREPKPGDFVFVRITGVQDGELTGVEEE